MDPRKNVHEMTEQELRDEVIALRAVLDDRATRPVPALPPLWPSTSDPIPWGIRTTCGPGPGIRQQFDG
jgi:hypothetical protein